MRGRIVCAALALALCAALLPACARARQPESGSAAQSAPQLAPAPEGMDPLTGLALDRSAAVVLRPTAVMIDNVQAALPQRGISEAGIVCESVTEGGITRLMAVFSSPEKIPDVGPVRSARDQFVQLAIPLDALFVHAGGSVQAVRMLSAYNWENRCVNGYVQSGALTLDTQRNASLSIEHCWFTSGAQILETAQKYDLDLSDESVPAAFSFAEEPRVPSEGAAADVYIRFSGYANSRLQYDASSEKYVKWQFGAPHIDENTGGQLAFDNVLVLFAPTEKYEDGVVTKVDFTYGGGGFYISRGGWESIRWLKGAPEQPLRIVLPDATETPVQINPGTTYLAVVPLDFYEYFAVSAEAGDPSLPPQ